MGYEKQRSRGGADMAEANIVEEDKAECVNSIDANGVEEAKHWWPM